MRRRFLMMKAPTPADDPAIAVRMVVVLNWFDEVRRILSASATVGHARALARCDVDLVVAAALPLARKLDYRQLTQWRVRARLVFRPPEFEWCPTWGARCPARISFWEVPNNFQLSNPRREL